MVKVSKLGIAPQTASSLYQRTHTNKEAKQVMTISAREMQMIKMRLELATLRGKDRFNPAEIAEITDMIKTYNTEIPADELVKQLLDIGQEKGTPLSIQEMTNFFLTTPSLDKNGQMRVLEFMKTLKNKDAFHYDEEYIKNNNTFEKFIEESVKKYPDLYEGMSEEELKKLYQNIIKKELRSIQYKAYTCQFDIDTPNISNFINLANLKFVYGVANCDKPEVLADIALKTGVKPALAEVPNELVQVYELCDGNIGLVHDMVRSFLPKEILRIVPKLAEIKNTKSLSEYCQITAPSDDNLLPAYSSRLANIRRSILLELNLYKQVVLCHLKRTESVRYGILDGNFERGKRQ